jgi:hypothetical protein
MGSRSAGRLPWRMPEPPALHRNSEYRAGVSTEGGPDERRGMLLGGLLLFGGAFLYANLTLAGAYLAAGLSLGLGLDFRLSFVVSLVLSGAAILFTPSDMREIVWELAGGLRLVLIVTSPIYLIAMLVLGTLIEPCDPRIGAC